MNQRAAFAGLLAAVSMAGAEPAPVVRTVGTVDVPNFRIEIVDWYAPGRLLLGTDSHWRTLALFRVETFDPLKIVPLQGVPAEPADVTPLFTGEPTSVAVHPRLPLALVTTLDGRGRGRGAVQFIDLRPGAEGQRLGWVRVGFHPDSIAISPDGRWAVVADEGEGDPDTPGTVSVLDLEGWTMETGWVDDGEVPVHTLSLAHRSLETYPGDLEPEYVAIAPDSRWALVTLQENDAAVLIQLSTNGPSLAGAFCLPWGAQPDGAALLPEADGTYLAAFAEEGLFDFHGRVRGHAMSLWSLTPDAEGWASRELSRTDLVPIFAPGKKRKRIDPEAIKLVRWRGRAFAIVNSERRDGLRVFDVTNPVRPSLVGGIETGVAPEGLLVVNEGARLYVIAGCEGDYDGPGEITVGVME
jgi:hypothetical protein